VLAGVEEALQADAGEIQEKMTAIDALLAGLFDYAGLYPPASVDMQTAVRNYLRYQQSAHRDALGRFVVHLDRVAELRGAAGQSFPEMRLSVIVPADLESCAVTDLLRDLKHVVFECKVNRTSEVEHVSAQIADAAECYFEIPLKVDDQLLNAIKAHGSRVKLRMGGVMAEAFPSADAIAAMLKALADRHLAFKATAGLHHPIRSQHPFTYEADSAAGTMHGFMNVATAATLLHSGATSREALQILEEDDPRAWKVTPDAIEWRGVRWSADQLRAVRQDLFISIGSCSFEEPIRDLESLGWL
jgi:hypothetical protein